MEHTSVEPSQNAMQKEWEMLNAKTAAAAQDDKPDNPDSAQMEDAEEAPVADIEPIPTSPTRDVNLESRENTRRNEENFKKLREANQELERKLALMEQTIGNSAGKSAEAEPSLDELDLRDDDIAEGKHYKALKREVRQLNEAVAKANAEREKLAAEARLRATYPDIFNIVTQDNMEELAKIEPELVESIVTSPKTYSQHIAAYKLIKKSNIGALDPYADDKARAQKNMAKPKSAATVAPRMGESPLSDAERFQNGMTPEIQAQLLREMNEAIANR